MMPTTTTAKRSFRELRDQLQATLLESLPDQVSRLGWSRAQIAAHQQDRLSGLLAHAVEHSPFHARRLRGINVSGVDATDLSQLPVMTKSQMMNELDDVFTDRRLTQDAVEAALAAAGPEPATLLGCYLALTSGGSSGQRGVFVLDEPAATQFFGSLSRGLVARLDAMGGPPPGGLPIAMVAAGSPVHATGIAAPLCEGTSGLPFRFHSVPVTQPLAAIVDRLNALRPPALFGYPSVLARLAREQRTGRLRVAPMIVTCTSETLTPELRTAISDGFGASLIDTFGSTEGLVGASTPDEDVITFAEDGCIVELVDEEHRPVPSGTPSAAVLVTNLSNRLQPLIRYELTDTFVQQPAVADHGHLRARVQGRSDDDFRYGEVTVHPLVIRTVLVRSPDVLEYQVHQTTTGIDVTAVAESPLDVEALRSRLAAALSRAGLADPHIAVRSSAHLDRDPATGKLRRFVPLRREPA
jgi:phenylacetate-coenzyme A ligase PaaK-like adenylate-forming protein